MNNTRALSLSGDDNALLINRRIVSKRVCLSLKRLTWKGGQEAKLAQLELDVHVVVLHEGLVIKLASAPKFGQINRTRVCRKDGS